MESIYLLNDLYWVVGDPLPDMYVDGNRIPLSQHIIDILHKEIDHPVPLRLYFSENHNKNYNLRVYNKKLTGIELLGAINTFWNELVPDKSDKLGKTTRSNIKKGLVFQGIHKYQNGYLISYDK